LATVGVPPTIGVIPLFNRIFPAASRLATIVLSAASPIAVSRPGAEENDALVAMVCDPRFDRAAGCRPGTSGTIRIAEN
jgi:hypothetical protein